MDSNTEREQSQKSQPSVFNPNHFPETQYHQQMNLHEQHETSQLLKRPINILNINDKETFYRLRANNRLTVSNHSMKPSSIASVKEIQTILDLKYLWFEYRSSHSPQLRYELLCDFLGIFCDAFGEEQSPKLLHINFGNLSDIIDEVVLVLVDHLSSTLSKTDHVGFYNYLTNDGFLFLMALEILTRNLKQPMLLRGIAPLLISLLLRVFSIPAQSRTSQTTTSPSSNIINMTLTIFKQKCHPLYYGLKTMQSSFGLAIIPHYEPLLSTLTALFQLQQSTNTANNNTVNLTNNTQPSSSGISFLDLSVTLIILLGNLAQDPSTLDELVTPVSSKSGSRLQQLLEILTYRSSGPAEEMELIMIQRQLIRALAKYTISASNHIRYVQIIREQGFFAYILKMLEQPNRNYSHSYFTVVTLELLQLLVFSMKQSFGLSPSMFVDFYEKGGYGILANNVIAIARFSNKSERLQCISMLCHLLFVGARVQHVSLKETLIQNVECFDVLLKIFDKIDSSCEMKTELLCTIQCIFELHNQHTASSGVSCLEHIMPFKVLFGQFDSLSLSNQHVVLQILDGVLEKRELVLDEWKAYCGLLQAKRPSTTLIITEHMNKLVQKEVQETKDILRKAGLVFILASEYFNPISQQTSLMKYLHEDSGELDLCAKLLSESKNVDLNLLPIQNQESMSERDLKVTRVLYGIALKILELSVKVLSHNDENHITFRDCNGVRKLYQILDDEILRPKSLHLISAVANGDILVDKIVHDLIGSLHSCGGTGSLDPSIVAMRRDILCTLCYIFEHNPPAKNWFRSGGGFTWTVSVLHGIPKSISAFASSKKGILLSDNNSPDITRTEPKTLSQENSLGIFTFLKTLLYTLSIVLTGNLLNQHYFRHEVDFSALCHSMTMTLQSFSFMDGQRTVELCDCLLNLAVKETWPPSCPKHPPLVKIIAPWELSSYLHPTAATLSSLTGSSVLLLSPNSPLHVNASSEPSDNNTQLNPRDSLSHSKQLSSSCATCKESLFIENPQIFKLIILLLGTANTRNPEYEHSYINIFRSMTFLSDIVTSNTQKLASIGVVADVLQNFTETLLTPCSLQQSLLGFLHKVVRYHISLTELKLYLDLMRDRVVIPAELSPTPPQDGSLHIPHLVCNFPLNLLDALVEMSKRKNVPNYSADFSKNTLSHIDVSGIGERMWPPGRGYTITFWFQVSKDFQQAANTKASLGLSGDLCLFSLDSLPGSTSNANSTLINNLNISLNMPGVISSFSGTTGIFSQASQNAQFRMECFLTQFGVFRVQFGAVGGVGQWPVQSIVFSDYTFKANEWYHVTLSHSFQQKKKSVLKLFVNGIPQQQCTTTAPKSVFGKLSVRLGASQSQQLDGDNPPSYSPHWQLGNVMCMEDVPTEKEAFIMYMLGPNYAGTYDTDVTLFQTYDEISEKNLRSQDSIVHMLAESSTNFNVSTNSYIPTSTSSPSNVYTYNMSSTPPPATGATLLAALGNSLQPLSLSFLQDKIFFVLNIANMTAATAVKQTFFPSVNVSSSLGGTSSPLTKNVGQSLSVSYPRLYSFHPQACILTPTMSLLSPGGTSTSPAPTRTPSKGNLSIRGSGSHLNNNNTPPLEGSGSGKLPTQNPALAFALPPQPISLTIGKEGTGDVCCPPSCIRVSVGVKDMIANVGGMSTVIYLITKMQFQQKEYQRSAVKLLQVLLEHSANNVREMLQIYGYHLLGNLFRRKTWVLDEPMLGILFGIAGIKKSRSNTYSSGIISNIHAFRHFILDWKIWMNAGFPVQKVLLESLTELVTAHDHSAFNIQRFREAGVITMFLQFFKEDHSTLPLAVSHYFVTVLKAVIGQSTPAVADMQLLISYLVSTHQAYHQVSSFPSQSDDKDPNNNADTSSLSSSIDSVSSPPATPRKIIRIGSIESIRESTSLFRTDDNKAVIRAYILNMILELLNTAGGSFVEKITEIFSLEILFVLMKVETLRIRVALVKILDLFLQNSILGQRFENTKGFHLLAKTLEPFTVSDELFAILFKMMIGSSGQFGIPPPPSNNPSNTASTFTGISSGELFMNNVRTQLLGQLQLNSDSKMQYPGAIVPILVLVGSHLISHDLRHFVVKTVHDLFLQNDTVKGQLLDHNLIKHLCDLFVIFFDSLQSQEGTFPVQRTPSSQSQSDTDEPDGEDMSNISMLSDLSAHEENTLEEDVLSLLKAVALHGCMTSQGAIYLDDILLTIAMLSKLPEWYVRGLQQRVLYDVLAFFHENNFATNNTLLNTFKHLCIMSVNHLCFQEASQNLSVPISILQLTNTMTETRYHFLASSRGEGGIISDDEYIKLTFNVFARSRERSAADNNSSSAAHNFLPLFAMHYSIQSQFGRLILHLFENPKRHRNLSWLVPHLANNPGLVADFTSNEEFIFRFLIYTVPFLSSTTPTNEEQPQEDETAFYNSKFLDRKGIGEGIWKIWQLIFNSNKSFLKPLVHPSDVDFTQPQSNGNVTLTLQAFVEAKKAEEKEQIALKEWIVEKQAAIEKKLQFHTKNQEKLKANTKSFLTTVINFQQQDLKDMVEMFHDEAAIEKTVSRQWKILVKTVTHAKAVWPVPVPELDPNCSRESDMALWKYNYHFQRWKLDPTEGTHRMRRRLMQTMPYIYFLMPISVSVALLLDQFIRVPVVQKNPSLLYIAADLVSRQHSELWTNHNLLGSTMHEYQKITKVEMSPFTIIIPKGERVIAYFRCSRITPFNKRDGELLIGESAIYYVDDYKPSQPAQNQKKRVSTAPKNLTIGYEEVRELHPRRYLLKNNAMEIFLTNGKTYLLAFEQLSDRDSAWHNICSFEMPNRIDYEAEVTGGMLRMGITKKWQKGLISNFEYLMHLNTLAGRSFNDLTQYPVFPFVLADYSSEELDLNNPASFRDLTQPMGAQDPERLKKFEERYQQLVEMGEKPFHYGSHYSNLGSVLHFLVRLEPFAQYFIEFQGGRFDVPDRAFHSLKQTWLLSSNLSTSDVKELIPEFFFQPEFLTNSNRFDMGVKQDGQRVDDLVLPPWAHGSAREFIRKHREALESKYVSENLHHWIDLMFGYKQTGDEAVAAKNVFHHLTYEGAVDIDAIEDVISKEATIAQISSYGQTPKQLFKKPHPERDAYNRLSLVNPDAVFLKVDKLAPYPMWSTSSPVGSLAMHNDTPIAIGYNKVLFFPKADKLISWGHWDQSLRICALDTGKVLSVTETVHDDTIICGDIPKNGLVLVTGGTACTVKVWKKAKVAPNLASKNKMVETIYLHSVLYGHCSTIRCVTVSPDWSIILSGSADGLCIVWDLNRLCYVRSLIGHTGPVIAADISSNDGSIVTVDETPKGGSTIRLWSVNGEFQAEAKCPDRITCIKFSSGMDGIAKNILATGLQNGNLKIWDAWNLALLRQLEGGHKTAVTAVAFSSDYSQLVSGDDSGLLVCWSAKKPREIYMPMGL